MIFKRKPVFALCVLALAQACVHKSEPSLNPALALQVSPQPPRAGQVKITLEASGYAAKPVTGARITLEGNMSHPGMAPVFADAKETAPGNYVSTMDLSMAGDWYVTAHVTLPDHRKFDQQFEINVAEQAQP